jgi:hypothetical protein
MAPVIAGRLGFWSRLNTPLDNNKTFFGQPIFGPGKTWRGLLIGCIASILMAGLQAMLYQLGWVRSLSPVNFLQVNWFVFGLLAGLGALAGDILKSFAKRQLHIAIGRVVINDQYRQIINTNIGYRSNNPWQGLAFVIGRYQQPGVHRK